MFAGSRKVATVFHKNRADYYAIRLNQELLPLADQTRLHGFLRAGRVKRYGQ